MNYMPKLLEKFSIGLDFGTKSVRAILVNVITGNVLASTDCNYPDGVIDQSLPKSKVKLPSDYALQNPYDWLFGMEDVVSRLLAESKISPSSIIGIGIDFTSCTILPTTQSGEPLMSFPDLYDNPHAWPKLWKHHAAQRQADQVNTLAIERNEPWLSLYGGRISSEWVLAKCLQVYQESPEIYHAAERIIEGADWIVWQLTGKLVRNACGAGYKATWHVMSGYPSSDFLNSLSPGFGSLFIDKFSESVVAPGTFVGGLSENWANRLGLPADIPIGAGIIDAHSAAIGAGVTEPGSLFLAMGTSTCHMLLGDREILIPGISGVVKDGIVSGLFGYEAGQASVGDTFAWLIENCIPPKYHQEAINKKLSIHDLLSEKAIKLKPGENGLLALDWWNGCRTPIVNAKLSGLVLGLTLQTTPEEIYRALIEATAFGTRLIIESFLNNGLAINQLLAGGGLTNNPLVMQIYSDITEKEIGIPESPEIAALGAAMLGAVAAGEVRGGYVDLKSAAKNMAPEISQKYYPSPEAGKKYHSIYLEYKQLVGYFGQYQNQVMEFLRQTRNDIKRSH